MTSTSSSSPVNNRPSTLTPTASSFTGAGARPRNYADASPRTALPALLNLTVIPPALRAMGVSPTSTQAVWLPSMMRCSRRHVVNGNRWSAVRRRLGGVEHHEAEVPRLQHERERFDGLIERALIQSRHRPGLDHDLAADPQQPAEIDAGRLGRRDVEHVEHIDERDDLAAAPVAAASICSNRLVRPDDRAPTSSEIWPRGNPPPAARLTR